MSPALKCRVFYEMLADNKHPGRFFTRLLTSARKIPVLRVSTVSIFSMRKEYVANDLKTKLVSLHNWQLV